MLYIKYSIYTNKGRKLKFPALSFSFKSPHLRFLMFLVKKSPFLIRGLKNACFF